MFFIFLSHFFDFSLLCSFCEKAIFIINICFWGVHINISFISWVGLLTQISPFFLQKLRHFSFADFVLLDSLSRLILLIFLLFLGLSQNLNSIFDTFCLLGHEIFLFQFEPVVLFFHFFLFFSKALVHFFVKIGYFEFILLEFLGLAVGLLHWRNFQFVVCGLIFGHFFFNFFWFFCFGERWLQTSVEVSKGLFILNLYLFWIWWALRQPVHMSIFKWWTRFHTWNCPVRYRVVQTGSGRLVAKSDVLSDCH